MPAYSTFKKISSYKKIENWLYTYLIHIQGIELHVTFLSVEETSR